MYIITKPLCVIAIGIFGLQEPKHIPNTCSDIRELGNSRTCYPESRIVHDINQKYDLLNCDGNNDALREKFLRKEDKVNELASNTAQQTYYHFRHCPYLHKALQNHNQNKTRLSPELAANMKEHAHNLQCEHLKYFVVDISELYKKN